jgi:plasmid stabilization system protein ParE
LTQLIWTGHALRDLSRLHRFLAPKDPNAARRAIRAIRQGVKVLESYPEIGRPAEEMSAEFREWFVPFGNSSYVVLCRRDGEAVVLLAIRHNREAGYS